MAHQTSAQGGLVWRLEFGDASIYYKPHDMTADAFYQRICDRYFAGAIEAARCFACDGYGYAADVAHEPVADASDVGLYFHRMGYAVSLLHALGAHDLHGGNWIARGAWPILIDLECALSPARPTAMRIGGAPFTSATPFNRDLQESLATSGFFPSLDAGGRFQKSPLFSDGPGSASLPLVGGDAPITACGHEKDFAGGFAEGYERCIELRDALADEVGELAGAFVRVLPRSLAHATKELGRLTTPSALADRQEPDQVKRSLLEDFPSPDTKVAAAVVAYEMECYGAHELPLFYVRGDGRDLLGYDGRLLVGGLYEMSALDHARKRLEGLGDVDLAFQLQLIERMFDHMESEDDWGSVKDWPSSAFPKVWDARIEAPCGDVSWLVPFKSGQLRAGLPLLKWGNLGLGVFFAKVLAGGAEKDRLRARTCLTTILRENELALAAVVKEGPLTAREFPRRSADGAPSILEGLRLIRDALDEDELAAKASDLFAAWESLLG